VGTDIAVKSLQDEVATDATSATGLYRPVDDTADRLGDENLAHRRLLSRLLSAFELFGGVTDHQPRRVQLDGRVGDHPLQSLVLGKQLPDGGPLRLVAGGDPQRPPGGPDPAHAVRQRGRTEAPLHQRKAAVDPAKDLPLIDAAISQKTPAVSAGPAAAHGRDAA